jgi:hypothetical protein
MRVNTKSNTPAPSSAKQPTALQTADPVSDVFRIEQDLEAATRKLCASMTRRGLMPWQYQVPEDLAPELIGMEKARLLMLQAQKHLWEAIADRENDEKASAERHRQHMEVLVAHEQKQAEEAARQSGAVMVINQTRRLQ